MQTKSFWSTFVQFRRFTLLLLTIKTRIFSRRKQQIFDNEDNIYIILFNFFRSIHFILTSIMAMYESKKYSNVHIYFKNDTFKKVEADKITLVNSSPIFEKILDECPEDEITILYIEKGSTAASFDLLLRIMCKDLKALSLNNIVEVLCLAKKYRCKHVFNTCVKFLYTCINPECVDYVRYLAKKFKLKKLKNLCDEYIFEEL